MEQFTKKIKKENFVACNFTIFLPDATLKQQTRVPND